MINNQYLKELRNAHDMTQGEVAKYLSISKYTYFNYEKGKRDMPDSDLRKLASFYGVDFDKLKQNPNDADLIYKNSLQADITHLTQSQKDLVRSVIKEFADSNKR